MRDPFPIPPPRALVSAVKPFADYFSLSTLPLHAHEVIFAFCLYTSICVFVSPLLSNWLAPTYYQRLNRRTRINWDVHVVSFFQSCIICAISLYIIFGDEERKTWRGAGNWADRIWSYSGMTGMCQSFALGYFLWDLFMCTYHVDIFGWGMLAHAISAVSVFSLGYRPFLYFYAPVFLCYELSSPFLNIHWFCDKVDLTGSIYQAINGALLTSTFFLCRICWGTFSAYQVFHDIYLAIDAGHSQAPAFLNSDSGSRNVQSGNIGLYYDEAAQKNAFMGSQYAPLWLVAVYASSNVTLQLLNVFWFSKMVQTIRKRFDPPFGTKGGEPDVPVKAVKSENAPLDEPAEVQRGVYADGHKSVEVSGTQRRSVRGRRKA